MSERLSGHTELIGLMAYPIRHSMSPTMHNEAFAKLGLDYAYLAFEVDNSNLQGAVNAIRDLKMPGANVSMPNKIKVCEYLDELSEATQLTGACNTIVNRNGRLFGTITDGTGFMRAVAAEGIDIIGKKITLIGAGGAGTAIAVQAALDGVAELAIFNIRDGSYTNAERTIEKINAHTACRASLHDLADMAAMRRELADSVMLVDATGMGMKPLEDVSPFEDASLLRPDLVVFDVVYSPRETKFLKFCRENGCRTLNGLGMMLYQGAEAFELWLGKQMPVDYLRELLFKEA